MYLTIDSKVNLGGRIWTPRKSTPTSLVISKTELKKSNKKNVTVVLTLKLTETVLCAVYGDMVLLFRLHTT